ncbi:MAG: EAL domain-containing protein [Betaproteobacteria bacterium]
MSTQVLNVSANLPDSQNISMSPMVDVARPVLETSRLMALQSYNLLDSAPEEIYDEITELLAQICETPLALINLVSGERQWLKSIHGDPGNDDTYSNSRFCMEVVSAAEPLEVADAAHDLRFYNDPLVASAPSVRFYAGVPLLTDCGHAIGTLCVMDTRPRTLNSAQRSALSQLTDVVMRLFEARIVERDAERLGLILENSLNEIVIFDAETNRVLHANLGARRNLGYSLEELKQLTGTDLSTDWTDQRRRIAQGALLRGEAPFLTVEIVARRKDGSSYPVESRVQFSTQYGRPAFVLIGIDISARKAAEEALHCEKELAQITLASIGDAMITTDAAGHVTYLNPVAETLTGWRKAEAVGCKIDDVFNIVSERDRRRVESPVDRVIKFGEITGLANNTVLLTRDGMEYAVEDSAAPIRNRDGKLVGVVLVFRDVTHARELANNLSWAASHDALTELVNRREFENLLTDLLASVRSRNITHAMLYLDLDQFKIVNDSCGHLAGDELLKQLSSILLAKMRRTDTLARLGGDEFGVLLEGCDITMAQQIAQQLLAAIQAFRFVWRGRLFSVSASIGVAEISVSSESVEAVMSAADTACFMAKDKGRNQVQLFRMDDEEVSSRHGELSWASRLLQSLEEDRFFLVFQHVQSMSDRRNGAGSSPQCEYVEVLLRMKDEQGRTIPPMTFIPAAERYQLMPAIDRWVIKRTMHCLATYARAGSVGIEADLCRRARFAINLSGVSLSDEKFLDFIVAEFEATGAPPAQLCFEITETAAISNLARVARFMTRLKAMGCHFALDDFGSGLSSFAYLKNLPVDYLKIDGMFVKGTATDSIDFAMVESIHRIGHVMGMRTIAEFVENEGILARMREIGVDYVQGYHLHQPEAFTSLAARRQIQDSANLAAFSA